ncbi:MAG: NAD-dependent epimerase/dehydratase family protein [Bryobacteraceae bacterium]
MGDQREAVLVTGAAGFLGRYCCRALQAEGFEVRALVRDRSKSQDVAADAIYECDLPEHIDEAAFHGSIRAIVHCAYNTRFKTEAESLNTNVEGTKGLLRRARAASAAQFVFISSLAAHAGAISLYGRTKHELEQLFDLERDTVIKPGTIVGPGGLYARTREMIGRLPAVPLFYGDRCLQTVWIDDLTEAIVKSIRDRTTGSFAVAGNSVPMREFYLGTAGLDGRKPLLLPFPGDTILWLLRIIERFGIHTPISSENLAGLKGLRSFDTTEDLRRLGIRLRSFEESLAALAKS